MDRKWGVYIPTLETRITDFLGSMKQVSSAFKLRPETIDFAKFGHDLVSG